MVMVWWTSTVLRITLAAGSGSLWRPSTDKSGINVDSSEMHQAWPL